MLANLHLFQAPHTLIRMQHKRKLGDTCKAHAHTHVHTNRGRDSDRGRDGGREKRDTSEERRAKIQSWCECADLITELQLGCGH